MKSTLASLVIATMLSTPAISATVDLDATVTLNSPIDTTSDIESGSYDTTTDGPAHYLSVMATQFGENVDGFAASGVDLRHSASRARASIDKSPGNGATQADARSRTSVKETYSVIGDGTAFAAFTIYGDIASTTDLANPGQYMEARGQIEIKHHDTFRIARFSTQDTSNSYFQLASGSFNRKLIIEFDVLDGDTFDVETVIGAKVFLPDFLSAGLLLNVDVKSGLRVYGADGATIAPSAVPLPASSMLLLVSMAGLIGLRRRQQAAI